MISRYNYRDFTWIDLESPTPEETLHIAEEYNIPHHITDELQSHTVRPKVENTKDTLYLVLHFPTTATSSSKHKAYELDFVIGKNFLITAHYENVEALYEFSKTFEVSTILDRDTRASNSGFVFSALIRALYKNCLDELDSITHSLNALEREIFTTKEDITIKHIASMSKKILDFRQATRSHAEILKSFESASTALFGITYKETADILISEYTKVHNALEQNRDTLLELKDTHTAIVSSRTQEIMKVFTVITVIMLPMTLLAAIFTIRLPEGVFLAKSITDFYFIIGAMTLTGIVMLLFFKIKKWI
jgi:magnesium transporter